MMQRFASVIGLPLDSAAAYEKLHADVWPAVLDRLKRSNVSNYSIYRHGDLLFSYMEYVGDNFEDDMEAMAADPITQEWWDVCKPLQEPIPDRREGEWWKDLPEIFHLD